MKAGKVAGLILIVAGVLGLIYGGFSYTKETHEARLGPLELSVQSKETISVPIWLSVGAIAAGAGLLLFGNRK